VPTALEPRKNRASGTTAYLSGTTAGQSDTTVRNGTTAEQSGTTALSGTTAVQGELVMSLSGYVAVPRCSVIFDGTNYAEFVGFMRIHMRGLLLWGVLSDEVPCPPCPVAPVAPTPPVSPVLAADASQADRDTVKALDDAAVDAYDQQVSAYSDALSVYRDDMSAYTQWCNDDARAAAVLTASVLPQFASEFMGLGPVAAMWSYLCQRYQPSGDALYLSVVRQEHALQQG